MDKVIGRVLKSAVADDPGKHSEYLQDIGRILGKLHTIKTTGYGFFDNEKARKGELIGIHNSNTDHFLSALDSDEEFHRKNRGHIDQQLIGRAINVLRNNADRTECVSPTIVHNDIADWNTVVDEDSVTGILDWDECFSGDLVFEFATMSLFYTDEQMAHIYKGYSETNTLPSDFENKYNLYVIRYIVNKSKIAIKQLNSRQNDFMRQWLANAVSKLQLSLSILS
jgi:aminoglycoside phosphotransferase (APT) family kinase protein